MAKDKRTSVHFDRDKRQFVGLDDVQLKEIKEAYPQIQVELELKKMALWLCSSKGERRQGNLAFITNWLSNATPPKQAVNPSLNKIEEEYTPLRPYLDEYLRDLWKGREYILELNKRRK